MDLGLILAWIGACWETAPAELVPGNGVAGTGNDRRVDANKSAPAKYPRELLAAGRSLMTAMTLKSVACSRTEDPARGTPAELNRSTNPACFQWSEQR